MLVSGVEGLSYPEDHCALTALMMLSFSPSIPAFISASIHAPIPASIQQLRTKCTPELTESSSIRRIEV